MSVPRMSPVEAKERLDLGLAALVDIREPDEYAREHVPGAFSMPLSIFDSQHLTIVRSRPTIIFMCQSGNESCANYRRLAGAVARETYVLAGGMISWKAAGLPTSLDLSQPIELQRQVMIAAGTIVLLGILLAIAVSPWFITLTVFMGCGLVFAGVTGWCGIARLLRLIPWNASMR